MVFSLTEPHNVWCRFSISLITVALALASPAHCNSKSLARQEIPLELQASDPEVKSLIDSANDKVDSEDLEGAFQLAKKAWELCKSRGLESDLPVAGLELSALYVSKGDIDAGRDLLTKALEAATERSNLALEAEILISLASLKEISGDRKAALETTTRALQKAQQGKSLYVQARAFGEIGRMRLAAGVLKDARAALTSALDIDRANHYSLEALHKIYWVYTLLIESDQNLPNAIKGLEEALQLAKATGNTYAGFTATNTLGAAYIYQGTVQRGLELLDVRSAKRSILLDFSRLEMLAFAYQAGHLPDKSAETWALLLDKARSVGNQYFIAEAAQKLGDVNRDKHQPEAAFEFYETAARSLRLIGNKTALLQVLGAEIPLLQSAKQNEKAPLLYAETLRLVQEEKGPASENFQFVLYLGWSFYYKEQRDWTRELENLEKAEKLAPPSSPDHPPDESMTRTLMGMWIDHAVAADHLKLPYISLLAMEQAFQYAVQLKDSKAQGAVMSAMVSSAEGAGGYANLRALCDSGDVKNCFESALGLNTMELLNEQWRDKWKSDQGLAISKITALPEQLTTSSDGVQYLNHLLSLISPIESHVRIPIDMALGKHYLFMSSEPSSARSVLEDADALLTKTHIDSNPSGEASLKQRLLTVHCWSALALAQTGEPDAAEKKLEVCLEEAKSVGTRDAMNFAQAASASIRILINNPAATEATEYWLKVLGDSADMRRAYSFSLARAKDFEGAIREMSLAAGMFQKEGRESDLAQSYISLALYHEMKKEPDYRTALAHLQKALALAQKLHDEKLELQTEFSLGFAYEVEGNNNEARRSFNTAQQLAEKTSNWEMSARCLWGVADLSEKERRNDAEGLYERAAALFSKAQIPDAESEVLVKEAAILYASGRSEGAFRLLLRARDLAELSKSNPAGITAYTALGYAYEAAGEYPNAILSFSAARDKAKADKNSSSQGYSDLAISRALQVVGEWASALQYANSALVLFKSLGDEKGQLFAYSSLMGVYTERSSELKDFQKVSSLYAEASALKAFKSDSLSPTLELLEMYVQNRQYKELIETATRLLSECQALKDNICVAHLHLSLAEAHSGGGEFTTANKELEISRRLVDAAHDYYLSGRFLYVRARLQRATGHLDRAVEDYSEVLRMISTLQEKSEMQESSAISENYTYIFDELISTLYQQSTVQPKLNPDLAAAALRTAEADKGQAFNRTWGKRFSDAARRELPADVREKESELLIRRHKLTDELREVLTAESHAHRPAEQIRNDLAHTDADLGEFVSTLRAKYPRYALIRYPPPLDVKDIPVSTGEVLVECRVAEDATYIWFLIPDADGHAHIAHFYSVPRGREWVRDRVQRIKKGISETSFGGFDPRIVEELTNALFPDPVYASLRHAKTIIYVPDDALALVPLEMLSPSAAQGTYPLAEIPTTYYPSTAAMMTSRAVKSGGPWQSEILGIGDPITSQSDPRWDAAAEVSPGGSPGPETQSGTAGATRSGAIAFERLPGTAVEVRGIAELIERTGGRVDTRLGVEATRKRLMDTDLRKYRFLHLATHGLLPVDSGLREPALLFSFTGNTSDMFLQMSQVLDFQLNSEMVVLSACNTGSGKLSKSEGVYNLGRAFLTAGSSSVVVSMWEVADNSTSIFMQELYRSILKGEPKNIALMHARSALIHQGYNQPFFWAPFVLMGE